MISYNPCKKRHTLQVLSSFAGYYIGTIDEDGCPYCRITPYYKDDAEAQQDLNNYTKNKESFLTREAPELAFCGCIVGGGYINGWEREVL